MKEFIPVVSAEMTEGTLNASSCSTYGNGLKYVGRIFRVKRLANEDEASWRDRINEIIIKHQRYYKL